MSDIDIHHLAAAYALDALDARAPRMHEALGTLKSGGTLRFSVSLFNTEADIDAALKAIDEVARSAIG